MEQLLRATAEADGERCCLTAFVEACRRGLRMPVLHEAQWVELRRRR